jgi:IS5 family transposase
MQMHASTSVEPPQALLHGDLGWRGEEVDQKVRSRRPIAILQQPHKGITTGTRQALPDTPNGRLDDLIESGNAHIGSKGEHPLASEPRDQAAIRIPKDPARRTGGRHKNRYKMKNPAELANLFTVHHHLLSRAWLRVQ